MSALTKFVGGMAIAIAAALMLIVLGTLLGAFTGLVVGWFFGPTILYVLSQYGLHDVGMWQLGATLGFVGGYFKSISTTTTKSAS